jgi:hypothetical protein
MISLSHHELLPIEQRFNHPFRGNEIAFSVVDRQLMSTRHLLSQGLEITLSAPNIAFSVSSIVRFKHEISHFQWSIGKNLRLRPDAVDPRMIILLANLRNMFDLIFPCQNATPPPKANRQFIPFGIGFSFVAGRLTRAALLCFKGRNAV